MQAVLSNGLQERKKEFWQIAKKGERMIGKIGNIRHKKVSPHAEVRVDKLWRPSSVCSLLLKSNVKNFGKMRSTAHVPA